ncbi:hypothetical protein BV20DRAFT_969380 [Pilatotrama ljubarskyi]|nr:hypothetical protein BV20DRAFT_969380 [Pilatotrama ljubarskyi]
MEIGAVAAVCGHSGPGALGLSQHPRMPGRVRVDVRGAHPRSCADARCWLCGICTSCPVESSPPTGAFSAQCSVKESPSP